MDDAGISFAYARNLSSGFGLVAQPGHVPVEGYSNLLWIILLTPFFSFGIFHPVIIPKLLSIVMVLLTFVVVGKTLQRQYEGGRSLICVALTLIATNTSFVVWSTSGMENPLYVFLLSLLLFFSGKTTLSEKKTRINAMVLGVLAGAIALTRPEGVIFFAIYPIARLIEWFYKWNLRGKSDVMELLTYLLPFAVVFGGFMAFRFLYFGDFFPNTYYAKGGPSLGDAARVLTLRPDVLNKVTQLLDSVAWKFSNVLLFGLVVTTIYLIVARRLRLQHVLLLVFLVWTTLAYILLPYDWMGEYRFATPFFLFFYTYIVMTSGILINELKLRNTVTKILGAVAIAIIISASTYMFAMRSISFTRHPTVPFSWVAKYSGHRFNHIARQIGIKNASLLTPDLGGTLYYSELRIYDLAGLCDKTIARERFRNRNLRAFHDYIFTKTKPTFIHVRGQFAHLARFDDDERFRKDYVAIYEFQDSWVKQRYGISVSSGDYVRRDVIENKWELFYQISARFKLSEEDLVF